jgi:hypothetical protein
MKLFLLTNEFKYNDLTDPIERVGIFDSAEAAEKAKLDYMAMMPSLPQDIFRFHIEEFELNKIY